MAKKGRSGESYKNGYKTYKLQNRDIKNKVSKLKRHIKNHPEDKQAQERLPEIEKGNYQRRYKPKESHSILFNPMTRIFEIRMSESKARETAGEQLSRLLNIPLPKKRTRSGKAPIKYRKKRRVEKS